MKNPISKHYHVNVQEGARVLHVLHAIHDETDPTLTYRYCCGTGQCGSCAVRVNGEPVLACMEEARDGTTIEPLDLPVIKDLAVDLLPYIEALPPIWTDASAAPKMPGKDVVGTIKPLRSLYRLYGLCFGVPGPCSLGIQGPDGDEAGNAPHP